jgi:hypothetical protein
VRADAEQVCRRGERPFYRLLRHRFGELLGLNRALGARNETHYVTCFGVVVNFTPRGGINRFDIAFERKFASEEPLSLCVICVAQRFNKVTCDERLAMVSMVLEIRTNLAASG